MIEQAGNLAWKKRCLRRCNDNEINTVWYDRITDQAPFRGNNPQLLQTLRCNLPVVIVGTQRASFIVSGYEGHAAVGFLTELHQGTRQASFRQILQALLAFTGAHNQFASRGRRQRACFGGLGFRIDKAQADLIIDGLKACNQCAYAIA